MCNKEELEMTPTAVAGLARKPTDLEKRKTALKAGGSMKTKHKIDSQEICRQVRDKE